MLALNVVALLAVIAQAYSQCIPPVYAPNCGCAPLVAPAPALVAPAPALVAPAPALVAPAPAVVAPAPAVIQTNSVASSLADTLSLLTVSSLLAEKLPYGCGYPVITPPLYNGCGCGFPSYGYVL